MGAVIWCNVKETSLPPKRQIHAFYILEYSPVIYVIDTLIILTAPPAEGEGVFPNLVFHSSTSVLILVTLLPKSS